MANHIFTGSGVALITPMNSDGSVNYPVLADQRQNPRYRGYGQQRYLYSGNAVKSGTEVRH